MKNPDARRRRRRHPAVVESLEPRVLFSVAVAAAIESVTGAGNNLLHPSWGAAGTDLIRLTGAAYADGVDSPNLASDPSARTISNLLNNQADPANPAADLTTIDQNSLSDFGYAFGQFIDHDLDLTLDGGASFDIPLDASDAIYPGTGGGSLAFTRSQTDPATGASAANPAQQTTSVTAFLDLSQVYGSDAATALALRTLHGGLMKTSPGELLPYLNSTYFTPQQLALFNAAAGGQQDGSGVPTTSLFATGDVRGNENVELTALTTLFLRNHNKIAAVLAQEHPGWSDEQLYQEARKINIAEYQDIVYNEWLPAVFGQNAMPAYKGYNPNINPAISNEFSTVAFRFGHSLVSPGIERHGNNGQDVAADIPLSQDFFDPNLLSATGAVDPYTGLAGTSIGPILKADADGNGQAMDMMAISDIRNLLFGNSGDGGDDLMARDVQRGRDNGIPDYNTLRKELGLKPVTSFAQITSNVAVQQALEKAYPGGVNTIDAFEGGLAEDHVPGSDVGQLFQTIIINQFMRLRDGDRFFYLNEHLNADEMNFLNHENTLAKIIEGNTNITHLQPDVMLFRATIAGVVTMPSPGGAHGVAGLLVQLKNEDGDVVATTRTNAAGVYTFTQQSKGAANGEDGSGVSATGTYTVVVSAPNGQLLSSGTLVVGAGDAHIFNLNFTLNFTLRAPTPPPPPVQLASPGRPGQPIRRS
ncbi:MAG TPA: peroxidase family protein [Phycisphaerae bacterium]|nr:peroxidase family protein [Phycisphaerae bacterium]